MHNKLKEIIKKKGIANKIAIVDKNNQISYGELLEKIDKLSKEFTKIGLKKGDHIGLLGESSKFVISFFSILEIGAIVNPLPRNMMNNELKTIEKNSDLDFLILTEENLSLKNFESSRLVTNDGLIIISLEKKIKKLMRKGVAVLLCTSGSTSAPKVVMHSSKALMRNAENHANAVQYNDRERALIVLPINFSFALTSQLLSVLFIGGSIYFYEESFFLPRMFYYYINKYKITSTALISTYLKLLSSENDCKLAINSLKHISYAGGPTSNTVINKLRIKLGQVKLLQAYGLTEAGPRVTIQKFNFNRDELKLINCGPPIEGVKIEIRNEGRILGRKEIGEVFVNSDSLMKGYYKQNKLTSQVLNNHWLRTGDIGFLDENNNLSIVGRSKNVVITMGMNIYPEEIEEFLNSIPIVEDAFVYGVEDEFAGEVLIADIVTSNNENKDINFIITECRKNLSAFKVPRSINLVKSITRTGSGKIKRRMRCHIE